MPEPELTAWERREVRRLIADRRYGKRRSEDDKREWKHWQLVAAVGLAVTQWVAVVVGVVYLVLSHGGT